VVHVTWTLVTFARAVPLPFDTTQFCVGLEGCVRTVTLYALPLTIAVENVKVVALALTDRLSPPLFCNANPEPVRPETVPPMLYVTGAGLVLEPPQDTRMTKASAARIEVATRRAISVLERTFFFILDTVGYLLLDPLGSGPSASSTITTLDELKAQFNVRA